MEARLLTKREGLRIGPLDGSRLIKNSKNVFKKGYSLDSMENALSDVGVATPEILVDVYQLAYLGDCFEKIYNRLPGKWNQKFLTQNQVIDYCLLHKRWLGLYAVPTLFICKKNEEEPVDENYPEQNLSVVYVDYDAKIVTVNVTSILECDVWLGEGLIMVVLPKIEA